MKEMKFVFVFLLIAGSQFAEAQFMINFDALPNNTVVTNQFPEAVFSSDPGFENVAFAHTTSASPPNILCTRVENGTITCTQATYVDFTTPVNGLTFQAIEANDTGVVCQINVFESGTQTAVVDVVGPLEPTGLIDLSAYTDVTRIEIVNIVETSGIGWDDFAATQVPVELMSFTVE